MGGYRGLSVRVSPFWASISSTYRDIGSASGRVTKIKCPFFSTVPCPEWTLSKHQLSQQPPVPTRVSVYRVAVPKVSPGPASQFALDRILGPGAPCTWRGRALCTVPIGPWGRAVIDRLTLLPHLQPLTSVFKTLTYQPSGEAPASGPRAAGRRTEPWTVAHLGPIRAQRWPLIHSHPTSIFRGARASSPPPLPSR